MTRRRASRKLYAADTEVDALEKERRTLELQAFGAEASDAERRARYFSIEDVALRRRLIGIERSLHELRQRQRDAAIQYWTTVAGETRANLEDLKSESPTSAWRQRIWWDIVTILWILGGAGWLAYGIPGAAVGTATTLAATWFIVRSRRRARPILIRQGEDHLRASERELQLVERYSAPATPAPPAFSESEAETGIPDTAG